MNLKSGLFEKDCDCVELLLLCAILFVDLCQGRLPLPLPFRFP